MGWLIVVGLLLWFLWRGRYEWLDSLQTTWLIAWLVLRFVRRDLRGESIKDNLTACAGDLRALAKKENA